MSQQRLPMRKVRDEGRRLRETQDRGEPRHQRHGSGQMPTSSARGRRRLAAGRGDTDETLEARLYPASVALPEVAARRPLPGWPTIHRELKRTGVTLQLLGEHRAAHPDTRQKKDWPQPRGRGQDMMMSVLFVSGRMIERKDLEGSGITTLRRAQEKSRYSLT